MQRTDDERLRLFHRCVTAALSRPAVTSGTISATFHASYSEENGLQVETNLGDEEHVRSLLIEVRKFLAEKSDIHFFKIAKIVARLANDSALTEANARNVAQWKAALQGGGGPWLVVDGVQYTPDHCWNIVINGALFHDDEDKAAELSRLAPEYQQWVLTQVNSLIIQVLGILTSEQETVSAVLASGVRPGTGRPA